MNSYGWAFMLTSTISVTSLVLWCFSRVLAESQRDENSD
jgi:hypothetical protein